MDFCFLIYLLYDRIIHHLLKIHHQCNNYNLNILGDGPERKILEMKIDKFGLGDRVSMPGFKENPWADYTKADVFLVPSRWEGLPMRL